MDEINNTYEQNESHSHSHSHSGSYGHSHSHHSHHSSSSGSSHSHHSSSHSHSSSSGHSHSSSHSSGHHHHHHKKKHTARNILIVLLCFVIASAATGFAVVNSFLNKINYEDPETTQVADPDFDEGIDLPDEYSIYEDAAEQNFGKTGIYSEDNVTNILICGIDNGDVDDKLYYGRSDSMMILSINNNDNTLRLASLSRAVYVKIEGHKSTRLSAAYSYGGPSLLIDTIQSNYKIKIDNFVSVNFEAFKVIVDKFNGVDLYLTDAEAKGVQRAINGSNESSTFYYTGEGNYHLDGVAALMYSRLRSIDSDRERTGRQRKVIEKIFEKVKGMSATEALGAANDVLPLVTTDLSKSEIVSHATKLPKYASWNTQQTVIPDKSSEIVEIDGLEFGVLLVDWDETISYAKSFFYPLF